METLRTFCERKMQKYQGTESYSDMTKFLGHKTGYEKGLFFILEGVREYAEEYKEEQDSEIGHDIYLSECLEEILRGVRSALSGMGSFDGGTLDSFILDLAAEHKLDIV